jgi:hypothetical protein
LSGISRSESCNDSPSPPDRPGILLEHSLANRVTRTKRSFLACFEIADPDEVGRLWTLRHRPGGTATDQQRSGG